MHRCVTLFVLRDTDENLFPNREVTTVLVVHVCQFFSQFIPLQYLMSGRNRFLSAVTRPCRYRCCICEPCRSFIAYLPSDIGAWPGICGRSGCCTSRGTHSHTAGRYRARWATGRTDDAAGEQDQASDQVATARQAGELSRVCVK